MEDHLYSRLYDMEEQHWWFRGRRAVIWALVRSASLPAAPRLLDAGCGTGRNLIEFGSLGQSWGVDPSPRAVEFCHRRGLEHVSQAGLEQLPFDDGQFDLVLACDVLEHIERDDTAVSELRRVAAPTSSLVITVPAYQWLWSQHDESHHHHRRYTLRLLRRLLTGARWNIQRATYFNSILLPPIAAVRALPNRKGAESKRSDYDLAPKPLNRALELPMRAEAAAIARGVKFPAGVSLGLVCTPA